MVLTSFEKYLGEEYTVIGLLSARIGGEGQGAEAARHYAGYSHARMGMAGRCCGTSRKTPKPVIFR